MATIEVLLRECGITKKMGISKLSELLVVTPIRLSIILKTYIKVPFYLEAFSNLSPGLKAVIDQYDLKAKLEQKLYPDAALRSLAYEFDARFLAKLFESNDATATMGMSFPHRSSGVKFDAHFQGQRFVSWRMAVDLSDAHDQELVNVFAALIYRVDPEQQSDEVGKGVWGGRFAPDALKQLPTIFYGLYEMGLIADDTWMAPQKRNAVVLPPPPVVLPSPAVLPLEVLPPPVQPVAPQSPPRVLPGALLEGGGKLKRTQTREKEPVLPQGSSPPGKGPVIVTPGQSSGPFNTTLLDNPRNEDAEYRVWKVKRLYPPSNEGFDEEDNADPPEREKRFEARLKSELEKDREDAEYHAWKLERRNRTSRGGDDDDDAPELSAAQQEKEDRYEERLKAEVETDKAARAVFNRQRAELEAAEEEENRLKKEKADEAKRKQAELDQANAPSTTTDKFGRRVNKIKPN